jgi:putative SOS response-associated peptidase YedK
MVAFAGLMESWSSAEGSEIDTAAILTVDSPQSFMPIHDRMPVIIQPEDFERWLDCKTQEPRNVADLMVTPPEDLFEAIPVSDLVNKVSNTGPEIQLQVNPAESVAQRNTQQNKKKAVGKASGKGGQMDLF